MDEDHLTPFFNLYTRIKLTAWAYGTKCYALFSAAETSNLPLVDPRGLVWKIQNWDPLLAIMGQSSNFRCLYLCPPPRGIGLQFWYQKMQNTE